jgi:hypothetical protein
MVDPTPFRPRLLIMHAFDNAETWEPALSLPLPDNPGLRNTRKQSPAIAAVSRCASITTRRKAGFTAQGSRRG